MDIVVPIKQVPETGDVRMDPATGTMIRAGVETVVNPLDLYAIEAALRLREEAGGTVTALTMGPPQAERVLREAMAMGCDAGALVSDRKFGGSDTWATSYALSMAVRKIGRFDLIVAGERATDGDTAQVGPGIAAWLDLPLATYVARVDEIGPEALVVERLVEEGYQIVEIALPALLTVVKEIAAPRLPTLDGKKRSKAAAVSVWDAESLGLEQSRIGLRGSPTKVVKIGSPKVARGGRKIMADGPEGVTAAVDAIVAFLEAKELA